jgi:hypothetical protein
VRNKLDIVGVDSIEIGRVEEGEGSLDGGEGAGRRVVETVVSLVVAADLGNAARAESKSAGVERREGLAQR